MRVWVVINKTNPSHENVHVFSTPEAARKWEFSYGGGSGHNIICKELNGELARVLESERQKTDFHHRRMLELEELLSEARQVSQSKEADVA